ncbi:MAG TPA: biotin synthase [Ignisphaera aggregans]|uniref:Biotin synthase n=1 Tax=Ignisphaera aggregans TaxID=334771 RepID=A0A833DUW7_9CREN|nr:biotin synthase [Ignisphaera aggregans]
MSVKAFMHKNKFVAISITGLHCSLRCKHCKALFLRGMIPVTDSKHLMELLTELHMKGVRGVLISGGFSTDGTLPITDEMVRVFVDAKKKYEYVFNIHAGIVRSTELALKLKKFVDVIDFEFTLSRHMLRDVRGLNIEPSTVIEAIELLLSVGLDVVPHVFLWHPWQSDELLQRELRVLRDLGLRRLTLLVFIPKYFDVPLPHVDELLKRIRMVRELFNGEIYLGCMRPTELKSKLDVEVVRQGFVDRIANPHPIAMKYVTELYDACCSLPSCALPIFKIG